MALKCRVALIQLITRNYALPEIFILPIIKKSNFYVIFSVVMNSLPSCHLSHVQGMFFSGSSTALARATLSRPLAAILCQNIPCLICFPFWFSEILVNQTYLTSLFHPFPFQRCHHRNYRLCWESRLLTLALSPEEIVFGCGDVSIL